MLRTGCLLCTIGLIAVLAQCGGNTNNAPSPGQSDRSTQTNTSPPVSVASRPGCGRFCHQAFGLGAGPNEPEPVVKIPAQSVAATRDGVVVFRGRCTLARDCVGAVLLDTPRLQLGRADVFIKAGTTQSIEVALTVPAQQQLRREHRIGDAFATMILLKPGLDPNVPHDCIKYCEPPTVSGRIAIAKAP